MKSGPAARRLGAAGVALLVVASLGTVALGQYRNRASRSGMDYATDASFDGSFQFCRIQFRRASNGDGAGWDVDFPRADQNLSVRLSELTKAPVSFDERHEPNHLLLTLSQPELFRCPFIMMTEVGSIYLDDEEAINLRNYLLKGGFLWADDFWGEFAWDIWESQIRKALPSSAFQIIDMEIDHPIYRQVINMDKIPQIPSIGGGRFGGTSERDDAPKANIRGIVNDKGRIMVLITHNTDFGDAYEREEDDPEYFRRFSVDGYAFGINALIYAMTH